MDRLFTSRELRRASARVAKREGTQVYPSLDKTEEQYTHLVTLAHEARTGKFDQIPFAKAVEKLSAPLKVFEASEYEALAHRLIREYCYGKTFQDAYHALYNLSIILLAIQAKTARAAVLDDGIESEISMMFMQSVLQKFSLMAFVAYTDEERQWFLSTVNVLPNGFVRELFLEMDDWMMDFRMQRPFAKDIKKYMEEQLGMSDEEARDLRQDTNKLVTEMKQLQRYPIQQSLYEDEMGCRAVHSWAVLDMRQQKGKEELSPFKREVLDRSQDFLAQFFAIYDDTTPDSVSSHVERMEYKYGTAISFNANLALTYILAADGELYYQVHPVRIPMREIFQKCGMEAQYEFLRFQFVARLFDLIVPREISDQTPSLNGLAERVKKALRENSSLKVGTIVRNLIVPRTMIIRNKESIRRAFEWKSQVSDDDTPEEAERKRQFLGRIGHPMRLRLGYKPHPKANEWAREDGFWRDLEPNETWGRTIDSPVSVVHRQKGHKK
ncbi:MAG: hypothetical protein AAB400_00735 [Patescibacteria group bacterium]